MLGLADSTDWYDAVGSLADYCEIPLPDSYKDESAWKVSLKALSVLEESEAEDEPLHDPEVEAYMSRKQERLSLQEHPDEQQSVLYSEEKIAEWEAWGATYKMADDPPKLPFDEEDATLNMATALGRFEAELFGGEWASALGSVGVVRAYGDLRAANESGDVVIFATYLSAVEAAAEAATREAVGDNDVDMG
ncbi:hypothetical protein N0V86_004408 [Didymella sp. IMI 355093]|nr:hypothetical protein N0V86_004408 [Didymella sp. IMI 355093]